MATVIFDQNAIMALDELTPLVTDLGGLNVAVSKFTYVIEGIRYTYPGVASQALSNNTTNYLYCDSSQTLQISTTGYPLAQGTFTRIARVITSGGVIGTIMADLAIATFKAPDTRAWPLLTEAPTVPPTGYLAVYGRARHSRAYLDIQGSNGRNFPLQPFLGNNRVAMHLPENGTTIRTWGIPNTTVGTISHPALASTNLAASIRRWRNTSAASANSAAENRCNQTTVWRGNADGLGGFTFVARISLATLSANCRGFFGLTNATGAISTTQVPSALTNCLGFSWDAGETTFRFQHNATGGSTRIDLGANFPTNDTTAVYTMYIYSAPNGSEIGYRLVREDTGAVVDGVVNTDLPANTTFLTHHLYMNNGGNAAAVAFDCAGIYLETDQ